ncbi:AAA family ATPase [Paractinoplanes globisporus]|uniref:AAA family ATPase n=1 Tax=Paractinoplanes globisporus TaxID=113565 RepID=A0ABW6WVD6_9ACTN|nr:LuxR family transcriptional regulator [Actinoplanes globisporus]
MPLLGREDHLSACQIAWRSAQCASAAVLVGAPGIGKTSLLRAATADAAAAGGQVLATTGLRAEADVPLGNLADLLDPAVREVLDQLPDPQASALRFTLRMTADDHEVDGFLLVRAVTNALRALCVRRRVVLAIDDAQWLDPDTARLLCLAATWLRDLPIGWLVAVRAGHEGSGIARTVLHELAQDAVTIAVPPLDDAILYHLVTERFPGPWPTGVIRRVVTLSGGNPYTALELARETAASGRHDARVPPTLADSLRARLLRLSLVATEVVRFAALTQQPTRRLLRSLLGESADAAIEQAVRLEVLEYREPTEVVRFTHPLVTEVVLRSMDRSARRTAHRMLASVVSDPDEAAGHLAEGTDGPDEEVAALVADVAWRMSRRGMLAGAVVLAEAALRLSPDGASLAAWNRRIDMLEILERADERERARVLAAQWIAEDPPDEDVVRGRLTFFRSLLEPAYAVSCELLAEAVEQLAADPAKHAYTSALLANWLMGEWKFEAARPLAEQAVRVARTTERPDILRWTLGVQARLAAATPLPEAGRLLQEAVDLPGWDPTEIPMLTPEATLGLWHLERGELSAARSRLEQVHQASEQSGHTHGLVSSLQCLMLVEFAAGRWAQADEYALAILQNSTVHGVEFTTDRYVVRTLVPAGRGHTAEVRGTVTEALATNVVNDSIVDLILLRGIAAHLELSIGDPAAAVAWLDPVAESMWGHAFGNILMTGIETDLIESYARVGRTGEAADRLNWFRTKADLLDNPLAQIAAARCRAVLDLATGDAAKAAADLEAMLPAARQSEVPIELGRFLLILGTARRRARLRRAATAALDETVRLLEKLGADGWAGQARAERAKLAHSTDGPLTPTEQRIVELVELGNTNAEIAAILLLREKTIEANLTRIYRKRGVRGRVDIARRADGPR